MRTNSDDWFQMLVAANLVERGMGKAELSSGDAHRLILDMQDTLAEVAKLRADLAAAKEQVSGLEEHIKGLREGTLAREAYRQRDEAFGKLDAAEAELAVRDNMGNEVLRILREATGKRDFHSEMEAAEYAAKMLAEARKEEEL